STENLLQMRSVDLSIGSVIPYIRQQCPLLGSGIFTRNRNIHLKGNNSMFRSSRRRILIVAMVLSVFAMVASVSQANHSWGGYHWARTANPFTLKVGNNVSSNWTTQFNTALADWSN